jgi:UDP-N-acetyl-D-mannosaminuronic acid dehydrogenase
MDKNGIIERALSQKELDIIKRIRNREIEISVIGLGHVGLPLALSFASAGFHVVGVDTNHSYVNELNNGCIHFYEPGLKELLIKSIETDKFIALTPEMNGHESDVYIITIGVNIDETFHPDLRILKKILEEIKVKKNNLIIVRSTVPPGTFDDIVMPALFQADEKMELDTDFFAAFVPERIAEGKALEELRKLPELIGVYSEVAGLYAGTLFKLLDKNKQVIVCDPFEAEYAKLFCNTYRYVNFALANQFALMIAREKADVDPFNIINICNHNYPRANIAKPGLVGGYCMSKDGFILTQDPQGNFIADAWRLNEFLPSYVAQQVKREAEFEKRIVVLGRTFKRDSDDLRYSPADKLIKVLRNLGLEVFWNDPNLKEEEVDPEFRDKSYLSMGDIVNESEEKDLVLVIAMNHSEYEYPLFWQSLNPETIIYDIWSLLPEIISRELPCYKIFGRDF